MENGQLSESIERNALKLVDYILANDKSSHSNLAQIAAPIASAVRQLCHKKQQVEAAILRDIKVLCILLEELLAAQKANQSLEVKLHAYKLQLQQTSDIPPATTDMTISAKKPVEVQLQEKDELIAALKITLDEVARETSQMEKLVVVQMDMIAELKHATAAGPVPVMLPPPSTDDVDEGHHHPDSQQSEGEAVPVDDGLVHKIEDFQTPLPPGWEMRVTTSGNVYFVHITSKVTTWVDPRTHPIQVQTTGLDNTSFPSPSTQYSMEFHEKRRIGIMFQPNFPIDQGASVHRVLPDTPAALARQIQPGHQLVAVNGHPIHDASFKHVMLLLQGGYRPLILTFDRVIKAQLHQRQIDHAQRNATKPDKPTSQSLEQLMEAKLMQLRKEQELQLSMHPKKDLPRALPGLPATEFQALADRTSAFEHYANEKHHWEDAQRTAKAKEAAADAMAETLKNKAMDLINNGLNLCFDDRALLWRSIVATRTESETLRHDADATISTLEQTKLAHPYEHFNTLALPEVSATDGSISPAQCDVWLLGRRGIIETAEKNSDTVLFYGAYFEASDEQHDTPKNDMRWLPCSDHAVDPAPVVLHKRATVDSWIVSGAGLSEVNGVYVLSGKYDGASKYTSVMGIELFRKRFSLETNEFGNADDMAVSGSSTGEVLPLPAKFRALYNERDFRVMQQIGSWLATQEVKAKTRAEAIKESHRKVDHASKHADDKAITMQPVHTEASPMVPSRPHVVSRLCRAWVLGHCHVTPVCSKRHYFISHHERDTMKTWQLATEANLDLAILRAITARELTIERMTFMADKAMAKYMANMHEETVKQVQKLVVQLNGLRLITVHVIEAIEKWRDHVQRMGRVTTLHTSDEDQVKFGWSASITITTGKLLFKGSNAFHSKVEAESAYDCAVVTEAKRLHTTVDHMPKKR
ncbi:hypothetical protein DYB35_007489 [Aphanomyces astaci]|uniref:WW domain-containing protein n=1 Tax=Aphanomyces astaci TaxID=112090 RepID=A0A3R6XEJ9_APHAT|nr:hypothetical protein DYB35_007489 [Aphanomyces astaci]